MTAAFIPVSGFLKMCMGFPRKIPVHSLNGFEFESYAKKKCLRLMGVSP